MAKPAEFSVVVPLYNKAPYIEAALRSILSSGDGVREVIVIDDGSTDGSPDIVARFVDPRIRLIRQANAGVSNARNRGLQLARFDWVAFLDADDLWLDGYIPALRRLADRFPECSMLGSMYVLADDDGRQWAPKGNWDFSGQQDLRVDDFHGAMAKGHFCFTGSIAVRRSLIVEHDLCFPKNESLGEDLDFFFRAAEHTSMALSPEAFVAYRDAVQVSRLSHGKFDALVPPFLQRMESRWESGAIPATKRPGVEQYIATHYEHLVLSAIDSGRRRPALPLLMHPLLRARVSRWVGLVACCLLPSRWGVRIREWRKAVV